LPILGAEHEMVMQRGVGVGHVSHLKRGREKGNRRYATNNTGLSLTLPALERPGYRQAPLRGYHGAGALD
jgi:hypothetical protein